MFKYSSVFYHIFLYYQVDKFSIILQKLDTRGNPRSIVFSISLFHLYDSQYPYTNFIDLFVHLVETMLLASTHPRITADIMRVLQLSKQYRVGDWYLYQNHTEIRIYGYELAPYKLPRYLPMRLFALEYYRQMINSDEVHFVKAKKKAQLRIKDQIGPFICNSREVGKEAKEVLQRLKLKQSFIWRYDPLEFICNRRQKNKLSPYIHHRIPEIEQYPNQLEWVENTLVDRDSTEVVVNNVLIDLERRLDEDSFVQVPGESQSQRE